MLCFLKCFPNDVLYVKDIDEWGLPLTLTAVKSSLTMDKMLGKIFKEEMLEHYKHLFIIFFVKSISISKLLSKV